jgi:hypothetical protein
MKKWLRETHGQGFELLRHFLLRFFDSDLVTAPGQTTAALIGAFAVFFPWFPLLIGPLKSKYAHFSSLAVPGPYREAVRADELWLITLMMSAIGLLSAVKWQSLFPGLTDYRALASLPLRPWKVFAAKLLALVLVITAAVVVLNAFPGLMFPLVSTSRWAFHPSLGERILAHSAACVAGCYFFFFGMVALQGVLLNLLRPRAFGRVTGYVQGILVAAMLALIVLSFSIQAQIANAVFRPELARWLPPVWFLGSYLAMTGDPDPAVQMLAHRASAALAIAVALALLTYLVSYHRHRVLLVEGAAGKAKDRPWGSVLLTWLIPNPRRQAVIVFMAKTLARSSQHRTILMGYGGFALAITLSGILGLRGLVEPAKMTTACFIYAHVVFLIFLLVGCRHLFSIPAELRANWTFQMTEREGRGEWLRAVDRFVLIPGAVVLLVLPLPLEVRLLGWRALAESALILALGLLCYEWAFASWDKLPFTCSHLPGKTPTWILSLWLLGLLTALPLVNGLLLVSLYNRTAFVVVLALLLGSWLRIHASRREGWGELRLKYEEVPDPAVHGLNLLK